MEEKVYNEDGQLKFKCERYLCHKPIWRREYRVMEKERSPIFCLECLEDVYDRQSLDCEENGSHPKWGERYNFWLKTLSEKQKDK